MRQEDAERIVCIVLDIESATGAPTRDSQLFENWSKLLQRREESSGRLGAGGKIRRRHCRTVRLPSQESERSFQIGHSALEESRGEFTFLICGQKSRRKIHGSIMAFDIAPNFLLRKPGFRIEIEERSEEWGHRKVLVVRDRLRNEFLPIQLHASAFEVMPADFPRATAAPVFFSKKNAKQGKQSAQDQQTARQQGEFKEPPKWSKNA